MTIQNQNQSNPDNNPIVEMVGEAQEVPDRLLNREELSPVSFVLEVVDQDVETGDFNTVTTFRGFDTPEQLDVLKSMLHQIADSL